MKAINALKAIAATLMTGVVFNLLPVESALALRGTTTFRVGSETNPYSFHPKPNKYYFVFEALNTGLATQDFNANLFGTPEMDNYIFNLTFWAIDFDELQGFNSPFPEKFGTDRLLEVPTVSGTPDYTKLKTSVFDENGIHIEVTLDLSSTTVKATFDPISFPSTLLFTPSILVGKPEPLPNPQKTPEPTSILGFLALGGLGIASKLKKSQ